MPLAGLSGCARWPAPAARWPAGIATLQFATGQELQRLDVVGPVFEHPPERPLGLGQFTLAQWLLASSR